MAVIPFSVTSLSPSTTPPTAFTVSGLSPSVTAPTAYFASGVSVANQTALKAIGTTNVTPADNSIAYVNGVTYQLFTGTAAENLGIGVVRPNDYNGSTNTKIWVIQNAIPVTATVATPTNVTYSTSPQSKSFTVSFAAPVAIVGTAQVSFAVYTPGGGAVVTYQNPAASITSFGDYTFSLTIPGSQAIGTGYQVKASFTYVTSPNGVNYAFTSTISAAALFNIA